MTARSFADLTAPLHLPPTAAAAWATGWEASQATYPEGGVGFLTPASVRSASAAIGASAELCQALLGALPGLRAREPLCRLAWHLHCRLYENGRLNDTVREWPLLPPEATGDNDLFFAFIALAGVPALAAFYRERGIAPAVFRDTMADVERWIRDHRAKTGRWGLSNLRWLTNHLSGNLFQLARLQFQFGASRYPYHAWRHGRTGAVRLLADAGLRFSTDGFVAGTDASLPVASGFRLEADAVHGLPIDPRGYAQAEPVRLPRHEWVCILSPGDPVLNLHIPAGSPMDCDQCGEAFRQANAFFPRHFPEFGGKAYVCGSWLLDPQLEAALQPQSNLVRFLKEVYLFPLPGATGRQTFERVFGTATIDPATAPRDTSLRRAILEHLERGGAWRAGGCVLFPEEVAGWGRQVYRQMWDSLPPQDATGGGQGHP